MTKHVKKVGQYILLKQSTYKLKLGASSQRKIEMSQALLLTLKDCTILHAVGEVGDTGGRWALVDAAAGGLTRRLFFANNSTHGNAQLWIGGRAQQGHSAQGERAAASGAQGEAASRRMRGVAA